MRSFPSPRPPPVCNVHVKPAHISDMQSELRKAREIYEKDSETIGWHVMQHEKEEGKFCIVERFMHEGSSQQEHLSNPYWKEFNPTVEPWLEIPIEILRFNEL
ncbi:ABM domain-containing protein [Rhodotorula toruloides]|nr:ABM domain-containing protein [Rhodotorula toruloides]